MALITRVMTAGSGHEDRDQGPQAFTTATDDVVTELANQRDV
jgi:hypothetical protein